MTAPDEHPDFAQWSQDWQAGGEADIERQEQIRHYVARRSGFVFSLIVVDFVVGGIALPVLLYLGVMTNDDAQRYAMLGLASMTVGVLGFGWWNWRGVLRASATSVSDYIAISAERLRRMRMAWRVAWMVLVTEVIVFSLWIWNRLYGGPVPASAAAERFAWLWLAGVSAAAAIGLIFFGRWLSRDAARFEALRRELEDP